MSDKSRGRAVDREQLLSDLVAADPQPGELVYIERRANAYHWERASSDGLLGLADGAGH